MWQTADRTSDILELKIQKGTFRVVSLTAEIFAEIAEIRLNYFYFLYEKKS